MYDWIQLTKTTSSCRTSIGRPVRRRRGILCSLTAAPTLLVLLVGAAPVFGGSATWNLNPTSGDWNTASNWTPVTIPNGPADIATFDVSNTTDVFTNLGDDTEVNSIVFNAGASAFTITVASFISFDLILTISGVGITNNSGITQNFVTDALGGVQDTGVIRFTNSSTAGQFTVFTNKNSGHTEFVDMSSASSSTFKNNGGGSTFPGTPGRMDFFDNATADSATLIAYGSEVTFSDGGTISFAGDSTGGRARVEVFTDIPSETFDGNLDISAHNAPGVTVGSIEGDGVVFLGANNLTVGSNNQSTTFSGVIQNGGHFGGDGPGSLTKVGTGKLILTNANTYTGGTTIARGGILVNDTSGSGTGTGAVNVNAGTLGGSGIIAGAVTVGTNTHTPAFLAPSKGVKRPATLTIQSLLTLNDDSTYIYKLDTERAVSDEVIANGVAIDSGAKFSLRPSGSNALTVGQAFTVINNTGVTAIAGTFHNLRDGEITTVNGNNFQADYQGGDGNDLTLTVVP